MNWEVNVKKCPFCAEDIQDSAIKCRWCGEFISEPPTISNPDGEATPKDKAIETTIRAQGWHHHDYWSHGSETHLFAP